MGGESLKEKRVEKRTYVPFARYVDIMQLCWYAGMQPAYKLEVEFSRVSAKLSGHHSGGGHHFVRPYEQRERARMLMNVPR